MGAWIHRLTALDTEGRQAVCASCGPVPVVQKSGRWICSVARKQQRGQRRRRRPHGFTSREASLITRLEECFGCGTTERLVVDHDHKTGAYRGVLCSNCNSALGFAKDDPKVLRALIRYLGK